MASNEKTELFETMAVPRALTKMAVPTIVSQLIILIYNMADTWFIGRANNPYMVAASSLVLTVFLMAGALGNLFGVGGGTLVVRLLGLRDEDEARRAASWTLAFSGLAALLFSLLCLVFMNPLLRLLGASDNTIHYARQYLFFVVVVGGVANITNTTMSFMLRNVGYAREAAFGLSMGGVLNIGLDPLFMFVILPLYDLTNIVINRLSASHGDLELAAIGIVQKVERFPLNIGIGICLGMIPLVGYNYAAGNHRRMKSFFTAARIAGLSVAAFSVLMYYLFADRLIGAFISDAQTVWLGTRFLRARCFATPFMFLSFNMVNFMQAVNRGKESFWLAAIRQIGLNIPILFLMSSLFGMMGVVWTQGVADILNVIVSYIIYGVVIREIVSRRSRQNKKIIWR